MGETMVAQNYAKCCDLISIYLGHFDFLSQKQTEGFQWLDKGTMLDEFLPFFYPYHERILMEELLFEDIDALLESSDLLLILESLFDYKNITKKLFHFYFQDVGVLDANNMGDNFRYIGERIVGSDLPYNIQSYLISFFLNPEHFTKKLVGNMIYVSAQISKLYENQAKRISDLTNRLIEDKQKIVGKYAEEFSDVQEIYFSFGILQPNSVKQRKNGNKLLIYLGNNYKENIDKEEDFRLDEFGKIFCEVSRIKILNYILQNGSVTVGDVNLYMGYTGTTSYYHLNMMYRAGMLKVSSRRKLLRYSIDEKYFQKALAVLRKYKL